MSTTSLTHSRTDWYTIVGRVASEATPEATGIVVLNRSSRFLRRELFRKLVEAGYHEIVSVEPQENSYTVEGLSREFPRIRFILLTQTVSVGSQINLAMYHMRSNEVFVTWSTLDPPQGLDRARAQLRSGSVCVAPQLRGERGESLPVVLAPALRRRALKVLSLPLYGERATTLFPFDYIGLYNRRLHLDAGGFDETIESAFWQKMDYGFRWYLWGGEIYAISTFRVMYRSMPEPEDQTGDRGYARFYAKNLAVRVESSGASVPRRQGVWFALRSGLGITGTSRVFSESRAWVRERSRRFSRTAEDVIREWSVDHV